MAELERMSMQDLEVLVNRMLSQKDQEKTQIEQARSGKGGR